MTVPTRAAITQPTIIHAMPNVMKNERCFVGVNSVNSVVTIGVHTPRNRPASTRKTAKTS